MSQVTSYVYCEDGKYYNSLAYRPGTGHWFICFDDDDPPEIVINLTKEDPVKAEQVLKELGFRDVELEKGRRCNSLFGGKFKKSLRQFFTFKGPAPNPREHDTHQGAVKREDIFQGVIWGQG